jgi:hypothetical protein
VITTYKRLIRNLPRPNQYLLLYVLDLLSVFARKSDRNLMTASGMCHLSVPRFHNTHSYNSSSLAPDLAVIFQPGLISHPSHALAPEEHRMNQKVLEFLISQQDWFLMEVLPLPAPMQDSFTQQLDADDTDDVKAKEAEVVKKEVEMLLERAVREFKDEVRKEEAVLSAEEVQAVKVDERMRRKEQELKKREEEIRRREEAMEREAEMKRKERQKVLQREESERHWKAKQEAERKQREEEDEEAQRTQTEDRRRTREGIEQKKEEPTVIKSEKTDENCDSDVEYNGSQLEKG